MTRQPSSPKSRATKLLPLPMPPTIPMTGLPANMDEIVHASVRVARSSNATPAALCIPAVCLNAAESLAILKLKAIRSIRFDAVVDRVLLRSQLIDERPGVFFDGFEVGDFCTA